MKTHKKGFAAFASVLAISVLLLIGSGIFTILASNVSMIKSSGEALQAQYFAQLEADMLKLVPYDELDNIDNNWQTFSNDENWQYKVKIGPEQNIDNTDAKMKIASIYVQKTGDMLERFSLQVPLSSQGSNTLPVGTILPYVGELSKIPHGWFLCDGTNGTPDLRDRFLQGSNTAGTFIEAGLPNITGHFSADDLASRFDPPTGVFFTYFTGASIDASEEWGGGRIYFDASRCSSIYGRSETVQPAAYTVYYIMRIM